MGTKEEEEENEEEEGPAAEGRNPKLKSHYLKIREV